MTRSRRSNCRVLVVDDEAVIAAMLEEFLTSEGFRVEIAGEAGVALKQLGSFDPDVVILDIQLPGVDGLDLLARMTERKPDLIVFMITAYATVETAVAAFRQGAYDYLMKPILFDDLLSKLDRALDARRLAAENFALRSQLRGESASLDQLVGSSPAMQSLKVMLRKIGPTRSTVLITGESGTGKELAAKAIHALGTAPNAPFLPLNVAAIPSDLLESQLFGHRKGAFTGADRDRPGLFLAAGSGTIFLDEIGELPTPTQAKLLRVIETREILPLGDTRPTRIDARVVAATNRDLKSAVDLGQFRADLYYRLNVVQVVMPALRDHAADIPEITQVLVRRLARRLGKRVDEIAATAMDALCRTAWKGNVRELENVLERAIILNDDQIITLADLPQLDLGARSVEDPFQPDDLRQALARAEQTHIETVLEKVGGDKREAASRLGMGLSSLYRKLEEFRARAASA